MGRAKRICYLSPMRAAKVQASLRIRAVSPEPSLLAHTNSDSRGTLRQKPRSLAPLNGWACAVKVCHDGMLEDTNSLGGAHIFQKTCWDKGIKFIAVCIVYQGPNFINFNVNLSIQYKCVNLSSIVQDFSPIIFYRSQLSFTTMSFPECMLPI